MNKWKYQKIGDVCLVERGGSPRPIDQFITEDEEGINWIKIGDTTESMYITETAQRIKPEGMKKSRYVEPGDFLLSNSMSFGRPYILKIDGCIHDGWLVLRDKDEVFDKRFLYYYLSSKTTYQKFKSMAVGGVVNNLNSEMVRKVDVPVPSKDEQIEVADLLDKMSKVKALRFDALMYGIELAYLAGKKYVRARHDLLKKVTAISCVANIPEIMMQAELINKILHTDYLESAGINEFEYIRENLRDLMKYVPNDEHEIYHTNFDDEILSVEWKEADLENDDLKNYKAKAEYYVRQHQDNEVIAKLKRNIPLTNADIKVLEQILWSEVGTKDDYEAEYGQKPLGVFVREVVGLDMLAAKEAFVEFLDETNLNSRQIYFVNQIVEFIVHNGMMKDFSVLQETPFTDQGSIVEVFTDMSVWMGIRKVIEQVNANALAA